METFDDFNKHTEQVTEHLKEELKGIRTGRASSSLIEDLFVNAYGGQSKLKLSELATITTDGPTRLVISPFDPSTIADIEKAIINSSLGLSPQVQGTQIQAIVPPLTQEQRDKFTKLIGQKIEEKRITIRNYRDEFRKKLKNRKETKEITEDDKFRLEKELDTKTQEIMNIIHSIKEAKIREIQTI